MIRASALAFRQLGDPAILAALAKSLGATLAILVLVGIGWWCAVDAAIRWSGASGGGLAAVAALLLGLASAWLLFRAVAIAMIGVFADEVVVAVERRHYPERLAKAHPIGRARAAAMGVRSGLRALGINLLLVPVYLAAVAMGVVGAPVIFVLANAWLIGRDLGDMVAIRHLPLERLGRWRREQGGWRFGAGLAVTLGLLVPVAGLIAPVVGAAMATHLFHREDA